MRLFTAEELDAGLQFILVYMNYSTNYFQRMLGGRIITRSIAILPVFKERGSKYKSSLNSTGVGTESGFY